jgi:hypothetical protein
MSAQPGFLKQLSLKKSDSMPILLVVAKFGPSFRRCHMGHYEIRNEIGLDLDENILENYYGNSWRSVFDRLNHKHDGYLLTIHDQNFELHVYRVLTS